MAAITSQDLRKEQVKLQDRLAEIAQQVTQTSDLAKLQQLASERAAITQSLEALKDRLRALAEQEKLDAEKAKAEKNQAELAQVEKDYAEQFAKFRAYLEQAVSLSPSLLDLSNRHVLLGGPSWRRYLLNPYWVKGLRLMIETWAKQDRREEEAKEQHTQKVAARRERQLAEVEQKLETEMKQQDLEEKRKLRDARRYGTPTEA